jgi:predicted nucleotidyltransferase
MDRKDNLVAHMDQTDAIKVAHEYAQAVKSRFDCRRIILFGSYAKGNFTADSDIDIAVIFKDYDNRMDMQLELMKLRRKIDSRIEPHPFRLDEFEPANLFVHEIVEYGREVGL